MINFKKAFGPVRRAKAAAIYRRSTCHVFRCGCGLEQLTAKSMDSMQSGTCNACIVAKERREFVLRRPRFKFKRCPCCKKVMHLHRYPGLVEVDRCHLCSRLEKHL